MSKISSVDSFDKKLTAEQSNNTDIKSSSLLAQIVPPPSMFFRLSNNFFRYLCLTLSKALQTNRKCVMVSSDSLHILQHGEIRLFTKFCFCALKHVSASYKLAFNLCLLNIMLVVLYTLPDNMWIVYWVLLY